MQIMKGGETGRRMQNNMCMRGSPRVEFQDEDQDVIVKFGGDTKRCLWLEKKGTLKGMDNRKEIYRGKG